MEQKPSRGPKNGPRSARTHTYKVNSGGSQSAQNADMARTAMNRAKRKKQVRRNRIIGLLVLLVLLALIVLGIVGAVRFFTRDKDGVAPATSVSTASLPAKQPDEPESTVAAQPEAPEENPDDYTYYEADMPLLLNKYNPLPADLQGELEVEQVGIRPDTGEMHSLVPAAAAAFLDMVEAAAEDGITLYPVSGYRNHARQVSNYNSRVSDYVAQGYSQQEAEDLTGQLIAVPGTSEHEAGLAIDINSLDQSFEHTAAFTWLSENCNRFGFILRYEKTTYAETGIDFEPWHYRYVGENHAYAITELGLTLEGYVAWLGGEVKTATGTLEAPKVSSQASASASSASSAASSSTSDATPSSGSSTVSSGKSGASSASEEIPLG